MAEIDEAVARVLTLKERLGLFDDPYHRGMQPEDAATLINRRRIARVVGARVPRPDEERGEALPTPRVTPGASP